MKDQEFIELLNLYLDHEISAADARRLEAEVRANPARYQVYREYCRMHKACGELAQQAEFQPAFVGVPPERRRPSERAVLLAFGSFVALAACVALAFALGAKRKVAPNTQTEAMASSAPQRGGGTSTSLPALDPRAPLTGESTTMAAAYDTLGWVRTFQVNTTAAPEPTRFEPAPDLFRHELRAVPTSAQPSPTAESAAFRFQR